MSCKGQYFQCKAKGLDMGIKAFTIYTIFKVFKSTSFQLYYSVFSKPINNVRSFLSLYCPN